MEIRPVAEHPNSRGFNLCAGIIFFVSLLPVPFFFWIYLHTHNFSDISANAAIAAETSLNFFGMLAGLTLSSPFLGRASAPFIRARHGFALFTLIILVGALWAFITLSGAWVALALRGFINHDFSCFQHAFNLEEVISGLVGLPILLNIPLTAVSVFLIKRLIFRSRRTA